jgi:hypothetical protein
MRNWGNARGLRPVPIAAIHRQASKPPARLPRCGRAARSIRSTRLGNHLQPFRPAATAAVGDMSRTEAEALDDEIDRFYEDVERLAFAIVHSVIEEELASRQQALDAAPGPRRAPGRPAGPQAARRGARGPEPQLELPLRAEPAFSGPELAQAPAAPVVPSSESSLVTGKRRRWTREAIIAELAKWMVSGTVIDARYVTRHGPPGLVAAARRIFGRFDAALNVASLQVTTLYPDGPPPRRVGPRRPVATPIVEPTEPVDQLDPIG